MSLLHGPLRDELGGRRAVKDEIAQRSRLLAGDDWSSFPPAEQHAFAFATEADRPPGAISDEDVHDSRTDFGAERALIMLLNASRYHYMTRISNGFQLKLERENVFYDYYNAKPLGTPPRRQTQRRAGPVALLSDEESWKRMPRRHQGGGRPLPNWAKAVAARLPRTAAAMLELDMAQRTKNPLDPVFAPRCAG